MGMSMNSRHKSWKVLGPRYEMLEVRPGSGLLLGDEGYWAKSSTLLCSEEVARHRGGPPGT